jgi:hypothetical protein
VWWLCPRVPSRGSIRTLRRVVEAQDYRELGESAWRWVRANVHEDRGPWLPATVDGDEPQPTRPSDRSTLYFGTGGLTLVLAELRLGRPLTVEESEFVDAIRASIVATSASGRSPCLYFGLAGDATALRMLGDDDGASAVLRRISALRGETDWCVALHGDASPEVPPYDVIAGMAGVAMAALWCGAPDGLALGGVAARGLVEVADEVPTGLDWPMYPGQVTRLPNFSHGTAGIVAALALAGAVLDDKELLDAARRGAEHLVAIGDLTDDGFTLPHYLPHGEHDEEVVTYSWCHGPTGTSLAFAALRVAGVDAISGIGTDELRARCLRSVLRSGIPDRLRPGFWDNDGQCCGTAGVGDVLLSAAQDAVADGRATDAATYVAGAVRMGDALVARAVTDATGSRWRFLEHREDPPLLAPGTGWSQGAAGIAAFLLHLARVVDGGLGARVVDRPDTWWSVPATVRTLAAVGA